MVARRKEKNQRTARANVMDLCDEGSFIEYGALAIAAQRGRRKLDELIAKTPTDGMIAGVGAVNGSLFGADKARCMVLAYDYSVLARLRKGFSPQKKTGCSLCATSRNCLSYFFGERGGGRPPAKSCEGIEWRASIFHLPFLPD